MSRRGSRDDGSLIPKINSIFQGMVVGVKDYGAFIKIPGCVKNGLVHISQLSKCRVDNVSEVVNLNDKVWCKVISLGEDSNKISLSMKVVHQGSGQDLDPNGVQIGLEENRRKTFTQFSQPKITLEAVFNTVCKKCGTKGHLAQDCFQSSNSGGKQYDLINDDDDTDHHHHHRHSNDDKPMKRHSKEHKSKKSKKKHKKNRSEDEEKSSSSSSSSEDDGDNKDEKEGRSHKSKRRSSHKEKKEKRGHRSSSTSTPSTSKRKRRE